MVIAKAQPRAHAAACRSPTVTFLSGALWLSPVLAVGGDAGAPARGRAGRCSLYLGVVTTGLAYAAYTTGLTTVSAAAAGIVSLLEPLTATLLGVVLFDERLGALGVVGRGAARRRARAAGPRRGDAG